ncbi:hypothetical protein [Brachymonas wangyanguii]|uniref:hypothetical protein n=1 Tax=Brachymonas wangyanguii TaxID=3130163 RepID=UPI00307D92A9
MASVIDICNLALARLGDNATLASIDPPEGSAQAEHCARFYPMARDTLLEMHPWKFATRRVQLAQLVDDGLSGWSFAYAKPQDCIRIHDVLPPAGRMGAAVPYATEARADGAEVIRVDMDDATLRYTARIEDTTVFPPAFTDALVWLLASYLAGPVIKGDAGAQMASVCLKAFQSVYAAATVSDSNQQRPARDHVPGWIQARG